MFGSKTISPLYFQTPEAVNHLNEPAVAGVGVRCNDDLGPLTVVLGRKDLLEIGILGQLDPIDRDMALPFDADDDGDAFQFVGLSSLGQGDGKGAGQCAITPFAAI
jgi:hypothetical protein